WIKPAPPSCCPACRSFNTFFSARAAFSKSGVCRLSRATRPTQPISRPVLGHALEDAIREYLSVHNHDPKPFVWTKTADQILASVARFCQRISDSGH
ncbi:MAG: hypothetical protein ACREVB_09630, partial [Burkholderiales bacterium]